jgi:hypothetical protein
MDGRYDYLNVFALVFLNARKAVSENTRRVSARPAPVGAAPANSNRIGCARSGSTFDGIPIIATRPMWRITTKSRCRS